MLFCLLGRVNGRRGGKVIAGKGCVEKAFVGTDISSTSE